MGGCSVRFDRGRVRERQHRKRASSLLIPHLLNPALNHFLARLPRSDPFQRASLPLYKLLFSDIRSLQILTRVESNIPVNGVKNWQHNLLPFPFALLRTFRLCFLQQRLGEVARDLIHAM